MAYTQKPLHEQVMVITGASSGIGLATAREAARRGCKLVLAARSDETLQDIVRQIQENGGEAIHVVADVSRHEEVQRIADAAIERFGGFDTWVNNAGLSIWGRMEQVKLEDHRRLFDINFWGVVHGSLIGVEHLKSKGGTLINLGSVVSEVAFPLQGMYSASKHAIKGFTDSLRMELEEEGAPVLLTLIKPAAVNTPFPQHAKNYTDREPQLPPPVYPSEEVAAAILHAATHPKRELYVGGIGPVMSGLNRVFPHGVDRFNEKVLMPKQLSDESPRDPEGTLYRAGGTGRVNGDYPGHVAWTSLYTRAVMHPMVAAAALTAVGVTAAVLLRDKPSRANGWID